MSPDAPVDPIAEIRAELAAIASFSAWWGGEIARMRHAKMAMPRAKEWQGPPYLDRRVLGKVPKLSPAAMRVRRQLACQARYLVARAERRNGA